MIQKSFFLKATVLFFLFVGCLSAQAQSDVADLFDEYCADCHSIGEGDMRGARSYGC